MRMLWMVDRDELPDRAAHRDADNVRLWNAARVEQTDGIVGHIAVRVGERCHVALFQRRGDRRRIGQTSGAQLG